MDLPDRRRPERPAPVHPAARIALVRLRRPVVHVALAAAVVAAAAQLGVEGVERSRVEGADLDAADQRPDVLRRVAGVRLTGTALPGAQLEVLVQELVHRRARARLALLVDLLEHARAGGLDQLARLRARGDQLDEVVPPPGGGVQAGVHPHPQRAARQLVDRAASVLAAWSGPCHDTSVLPSRVTFGVTRPSLELSS
jgi:hypothetical protein